MYRVVVVEPVSPAFMAMKFRPALKKAGNKTVPVTTVRKGLAYPRADAFETDHEFVFRLDVPGASRGDIRVAYDSGHIRVVWQKKAEAEAGSRILSRESQAGTFTRTFALPASTDIERISAEVRDGVITIRAPKRAPESKHQIEVS